MSSSTGAFIFERRVSRRAVGETDRGHVVVVSHLHALPPIRVVRVYIKQHAAQTTSRRPSREQG